MRRGLRQICYRKADPMTHNLVIYWKEGGRPGATSRGSRDEPWFLVTDLAKTTVKLTDTYGQRMTIEELFRKGKNQRNRWALWDMQLEKASRLDRRLLILALAYWLLVWVGLLAKQQYLAGQWCSSNDSQQCSVFTIAQILLDDIQVSVGQALAVILVATIEILGKLGRFRPSETCVGNKFECTIFLFKYGVLIDATPKMTHTNKDLVCR
jgi:hypothetical protein